jgi:hypothetical protein
MKNKIEILVENIEDDYVRKFVQSEIAHCSKHRVKVELLEPKQSHLDVESSGYFSDEPKPQLQVIVCGGIDHWLPTFVHESCHKDQFVEKSEVWMHRVDGQWDGMEMLDMWLTHSIELKPKQMHKVLEYIINVELDCEKRVVHKIRQHQLPIDTTEYVQKANSYLWYYHAVSHARSYTQRKAPYNNPKIWREMPADFDNNYSTIKPNMLELYMEHCW